jgi:hypothetical protein
MSLLDKDPGTHIFVWCQDRKVYESFQKGLLMDPRWCKMFRVKSSMDRSDFSFYIEMTAVNPKLAVEAGFNLENGLKEYIEKGAVKIKYKQPAKKSKWYEE